MAFGAHWEWRGFGALDPALRRRLEALPRKFSTSQRLSDEYLFVPGCPLNVKLREGDLKFKRILEVSRGLERWLEDESENYPFPVAPELAEKLARELGIAWPQTFDAPLGRSELLDALRKASRDVQVITVDKDRLQLEWGSGEDAVTVEIAEIERPERITSVSLEHPDRERATAALEALDLPQGLRQLNYLEALRIWAGGDNVGR